MRLIVGIALLGSVLLYAQQTRSLSDTATQLLPQKSPTGALLRSLLVPGWGQLYVGAYWKAPIFFLGTAAAAYFTVANHRLYLRYQRELEDAYARSASAWDIATLRAYRTFAVQQRDLALAFWIGTYVLAAIDAYVGAELSSFDVSDRLTLLPRVGAESVGITLAWSW